MREPTTPAGNPIWRWSSLAQGLVNEFDVFIEPDRPLPAFRTQAELLTAVTAGRLAIFVSSTSRRIAVVRMRQRFLGTKRDCRVPSGYRGQLDPRERTALLVRLARLERLVRPGQQDRLGQGISIPQTFRVRVLLGSICGSTTSLDSISPMTISEVRYSFTRVPPGVTSAVRVAMWAGHTATSQMRTSTGQPYLVRLSTMTSPAPL